MPKKPIRSWVLIADGARARILVNEGRGSGLEPVPGKDFNATHAATRVLGADKPGRVFESADSARHAMAPRVDWHEYEKHLFARMIAADLDKAAERRAFDRLVLVAPPKSLGELRAALGAETRKKVTAELAKDLTSIPDHDLAPHLAETVPL